MALARPENTAQRFYSLSSQIRQERKADYDILASTQTGRRAQSPAPDHSGWTANKKARRGVRRFTRRPPARGVGCDPLKTAPRAIPRASHAPPDEAALSDAGMANRGDAKMRRYHAVAVAAVILIGFAAKLSGFSAANAEDARAAAASTMNISKLHADHAKDLSPTSVRDMTFVFSAGE